jgi:hypothetical protein
MDSAQSVQTAEVCWTPLYSTQESKRIAGLQAGAVGPRRYLRPNRPPVRSKVTKGGEMSAAPLGHAAVPRRRDSTGDAVTGGSLATALGCARPGRKGAREHLQVKITARREGRLEDTHGAASPGAHRRWVDNAGLAAALGCSPAQPSPLLHTQHKVATARRPAHRMARRGGLRLTSRSGIKNRARRRAAAAVHRRGTDSWRWGVHGHSPRASIPCTRSPWHEGRLPELPVAAHGATPGAGALDFTTAWSWPRRAGVRPARTHARTRVRLQGNNTAHRRPRHGSRQAHGSAARRGVALGPAIADEARRHVRKHS